MNICSRTWVAQPWRASLVRSTWPNPSDGQVLRPSMTDLASSIRLRNHKLQGDMLFCQSNDLRVQSHQIAVRPLLLLCHTRNVSETKAWFQEANSFWLEIPEWRNLCYGKSVDWWRNAQWILVNAEKCPCRRGNPSYQNIRWYQCYSNNRVLPRAGQIGPPALGYCSQDCVIDVLALDNEKQPWRMLRSKLSEILILTCHSIYWTFSLQGNVELLENHSKKRTIWYRWSKRSRRARLSKYKSSLSRSQYKHQTWAA